LRLCGFAGDEIISRKAAKAQRKALILLEIFFLIRARLGLRKIKSFLYDRL
jgi:hypothetical protein